MIDICSLAARFGVAGLLLAAVPLGPSARTASGADDPIAALAAAVSPGVAKERLDEYRRRLLTVQRSAQNCDRFVDRYGDRPLVKAILSGLDHQPGELHFVQPSDMQALRDAVGGSLGLSGLDLERCVHVGDLGARARPQGAVTASLRSCLRALDRSGPNGAAVAILEGAARGLADDTFTKTGTLARLEQAVGDLPLTAEDLETCVDAFHTNAVLDRERESRLVSAGPLAAPGVASAAEFSPCAGSDRPIDCQGRIGNTGYFECCSPDQECRTINIWNPDERKCQAKSCFPATAKVRLEDGSEKAMADVRLGDRVLAARADGTLGYEEVYLSTHKDAGTAAAYVELTLASGRTLTLSPRHFIPTAGAGSEAFAEHVVKAADEVRVGDLVWSRGEDGGVASDAVIGARTKVEVGAFNPLTMNGTIVVDGVVASAHSDWFLDGIVSADRQARVYQAVLAPVRLAYQALGPARMETVTEKWGVVDAVRDATVSGGRGWYYLAGLLALVAVGVALTLRRRRAATL